MDTHLAAAILSGLKQYQNTCKGSSGYNDSCSNINDDHVCMAEELDIVAEAVELPDVGIPPVAIIPQQIHIVNGCFSQHYLILP